MKKKKDKKKKKREENVKAFGNMKKMKRDGVEVDNKTKDVVIREK